MKLKRPISIIQGAINMSTAVLPVSTGTPPPDVLTQIRAEYSTRFLVVQALNDLETQKAAAISAAIAKWATDSATKGAVDPAGTVTAETALNTATGVINAQEQSLRNMEALLEKQIELFKKTNLIEVVQVLDEQIQALGAMRHVQEVSEKKTQNLLKSLLHEKSQLAGPAPRHR
jgi:hypothetical protein